MLFKIFFKDAYKWYEAKTLRAYGSEDVKPRTKRKKFSTLKKKAPRVPDYTCPIIDNVLDALSSSPNIKACRRPPCLEKGQIQVRKTKNTERIIA